MRLITLLVKIKILTMNCDLDVRKKQLWQRNLKVFFIRKLRATDPTNNRGDRLNKLDHFKYSFLLLF